MKSINNSSENNTFSLEYDKVLLKKHQKEIVQPSSKLELRLILAGRGKCLIGNKDYDFTQGDVFIINNIEASHTTYIASDAIEYLKLSFPVSYIATDENDQYGCGLVSVFYREGVLFSKKIPAYLEISKLLFSLFIQIVTELESKNHEYKFVVKSYMFTLLSQILRHYSNIEATYMQKKQKNSSPLIIDEIISYIDNNISQTLTLSMFADIAHMNPFYFSTFFKKYTYMSPKQYILKSRIDKAVNLLQDTDKSILEIALLCGFNNTSNFNKSFKNITGKKPSDYRK